MPRRRRQPPAEIQIKKHGRTHVRYLVSCTGCDATWFQTTPAYAEEAGALHIARHHAEQLQVAS